MLEMAIFKISSYFRGEPFANKTHNYPDFDYVEYPLFDLFLLEA